MAGGHLARDRRKLQKLLKAVREEANLTQVQVAERLGAPQSFVSKYESGERRLELAEIDAICSAIGISLTDFVRRYANA
jgi:transcriptional regulator with XRE-family HTH domain